MSSKLIKNIYKQFNKLAKYLDDNDKQIMIISLISYSTLTNHLDNINDLIILRLSLSSRYFARLLNCL